MSILAALSPAALANTVTSYATVLAGILCIVLTLLTRPQPNRWLFAYLCIVITGAAAVWFHGFGQTPTASIVDTGTSLLLAWSLQFAVLGDYYLRRNRVVIAGVSGAVNLAALLFTLLASPVRTRMLAIPLGSNYGYRVTQVVLVLDAALIVALFFAKLGKMYVHSRPLLYLNVALFLVGMVLAGHATATVDYRVVAYHATWHVVAALGFVTLWVFNFVRFTALKIK